MDNAPENTLVVLGPTASGKTALGVCLARAVNGEILSADSRQVYVGLDLCSGKDLHEYREGGAPVPYHLIDIAPISAEFSVFHYQQAFYRCFEDVLERGCMPVIVGGTGMYLDAALRSYRMVEAPENPALRRELAGMPMAALADRLCALKPALHNTTDLQDRARVIRAIEIAEYARDHAPPWA
ncbi:MAG TPA: tRNA (adenosine(37)-N6)-dimethylallyltransferase MiaA, partial [Candidatus Hydrogenedentes bacterium]|nr:tRNA (adenosine(37)-N6)-dimethylallyltransferase MiaA [Candidatus Hydrogenedentota bacterium]